MKIADASLIGKQNGFGKGRERYDNSPDNSKKERIQSGYTYRFYWLWESLRWDQLQQITEQITNLVICLQCFTTNTDTVPFIIQHSCLFVLRYSCYKARSYYRLLSHAKTVLSSGAYFETVNCQAAYMDRLGAH